MKFGLAISRSVPGLRAHVPPQTPYPLINLAHRLPQTIQGTSPLQIRTRVFDNLVFGFKRDKDAENVFCSVKETVASELTQHHSGYV
mgnify:FL=1